MKAKLFSGYIKLLSALLVMLGFAACDIYGPDEYGAPSATYKVKGKVLSRSHLQPIVGIRVSVEGGGHTYTTVDGDTVTQYHNLIEFYTDAAGTFDVQMMDDVPTGKLRATFEDTDGIENGGLFATRQDTTTIPLSQLQNGSGNWYAGEATWDLGTVELDIKQ
jgi:putative lipoprotein (rSAM/lipoprotein system)